MHLSSGPLISRLEAKGRLRSNEAKAVHVPSISPQISTKLPSCYCQQQQAPVPHLRFFISTKYTLLLKVPISLSFSQAIYNCHHPSSQKKNKKKSCDWSNVFTQTDPYPKNWLWFNKKVDSEISHVGWFCSHQFACYISYYMLTTKS